jgi:hypothetical protein
LEEVRPLFLAAWFDELLGWTHAVLVSCPGCASGQLETFDRTTFFWDENSDWYAWYLVESSDMAYLTHLLESCPQPLSASDCTCSVHHAARFSLRSLPPPPDRTAVKADLPRLAVEVARGAPRLTAPVDEATSGTVSESPSRSKPVTFLAWGIRLLTAVEAQLNGDPDPAANAVDQFGVLVPEGPPPQDVDWFEQARLAEETRDRDGMAAYYINHAIRALRELLERHERSRVARRALNWSIGAPYLGEEQLLGRLFRMGGLEESLSKIRTANVIARAVHSQERRDDGSFYLTEHVYPLTYEVARWLWLQGKPPATVLEGALVALLHDTLENSTPGDAPRVLDQIRSHLGDAVADQVVALSKAPKSDYSHLSPDDAKAQREAEYFKRILAASDLVKLVKTLDRINNLLCVHKSRNKVRGYIEETIQFHLPLAAQVDSVLVEEIGYVIENLRARLELEEDLGENEGGSEMVPRVVEPPSELPAGIIARVVEEGGMAYSETWTGSAWRRGGATIAEVTFGSRTLTAAEVARLGLTP